MACPADRAATGTRSGSTSSLSSAVASAASAQVTSVSEVTCAGQQLDLAVTAAAQNASAAAGSDQR